MSQLILGIDAGNHRGKTVGAYGVDSYRTAICDWFARDIVESFDQDDMEFEINGRKGFAGTIAAYEDIHGAGAMYGDSKVHEDTLIRVLLSIYRYTRKYNIVVDRISIVIGQPIVSHKENEKKEMKKMLEGEHHIVVNGKHHRFIIENVGIAPEGSGAFWCHPQMETVRIIDIGSGTVNAATIIDKRHINNASGTFNFGVETAGKNIEGLARDIIRLTTRLKWGRNDEVYLCGGIANNITPYLTQHYPKAQVTVPHLRKHNGGIEILEPVFANAVGFYEIARLTYQ